jgi:threonine synthase
MSSPTPSGFRCVRCGARYGLETVHFGCPVCAAGVPSNLEITYEGPVRLDRGLLTGRGVWRYRDALPVSAGDAVSLGEGATPLLDLERLGEEAGLPLLQAKNEAQNPTWSFKDRLASLAVSWARAQRRAGVVISSSGNAGAAAAAYASRAGMPCLVLTTAAFPGTMQRFMRSFGAMVVAAPTAADRWTLARAVAREWGWVAVSNVADPPVGSHPAGVEGCKTIAYEIVEDLGWTPPDVVVVPVAYGDSLSGIHRGFRELREAGLIERVPRLVAVEAYPSLSRTLADAAGGPVRVEASGSQAFSVATQQGTFQALRAIRETGGTAVAVGDEEALRAQRDLREREGLLVELSAAMPLAAARRLASAGWLAPGERVVLLVTSGGLKDLEVTDRRGELPAAEPDLSALTRVLERSYGFAA